MKALLPALLLVHVAHAQIAWVRYPGPTLPLFCIPLFDPVHQRLLAVGYGAPPNMQLAIQERSGVSWQAVGAPTTVTGQIPRVVAYDTVRSRVVMADQYMGTYEWDGVNWTTAFQPPNPGIEVQRGCFDPVGQRLVVVGSVPGQLPIVMQTWSWNGLVWSRIITTQEIPADCRSIAFSSATGKVTACSYGPIDPGTTWELLQNDWMQVGAGPTGGFSSSGDWMTYDPSVGRLVARRGSDTFEWNGASWMPMMTSGPVVGGFGMATGTPLGVAVGQEFAIGVRGPTASIALLGPGCPGGHGPISLTMTEGIIGTAELALGRIYRAQPLLWSISGLSQLPFARWWVAIGFSSTLWDSTPLPFDLSGYNMPGCSLRVSIDMLLLQSGNTGGIAVPSGHEWLGMPFYVQAVVQDFGPQGPYMAVSDAYHGIVGVSP